MRLSPDATSTEPTDLEQRLLQNHERNNGVVAKGVLQRKSRISQRDILATSVCLLSFAAAYSCIQIQHMAIQLGQANQLIIIGFLLSLMGLSAAKIIRHALLAYEVRTGTTLQTLDSLITMSPLADHATVPYRAIISVLLALPLALSAGYKSFQGGSSESYPFRTSAQFDITGPPGTQGMGFGLSLMVNATIPWFQDPGFDRLYGFNMYVASENTTVMLDGPLPSFVADIKSKLKDFESVSVTANFSAVFTDLSDHFAESKEWLNETFYENIQNPQWEVTYEQWVYNKSSWLGIMNPRQNNYTMMWMSWWTLLQNQSFGSQVRQYNVSRQQVSGTWKITKDIVSLVSVSIPSERILVNNDVLTNNTLAAHQLFITSLTEFDWNFRYIGKPYENTTKYEEYIKNDSTLVASMIWARIVGLNGPENGNMDPNLRYERTAWSTKTRATLKRSWALFFIIVLYPLLSIFSLCIRVFFFFDTPIGEAFGIVSLLAAARSNSLKCLKGAALSGSLQSRMRIRFTVEHHRGSGSSSEYGEIRMELNESGKSGHLRARDQYG